ncbi:MAG: flagellar hook-length control protein FliK [Terriglobia bacterium]
MTEFSSRLENFAEADLPAASNPPLPVGQADQAAPLFGPKASDPSTPSSASAHPELAEFSSRLEKFAGAETNLKVFGNESPQATAPEKFPTGNAPVAAGILGSGLPNTVVASVQIPAAPKSGDWADHPTRDAMHPAQVSNTTITEVEWQKVVEPAPTSAQSSLSFSAGPAPSQQTDTKSQSVVTLANPSRTTAAAEPTPVSGPVSANSGESTAHTGLADSSTTGQGKSCQQSASAPGNQSPDARTFAPSLTNNPAADPTASLLTAQAPSLPASHAGVPAPQTPISSGQPPTTLSAWQSYDGGAGKIVRSASLSDSAHGAEMHVELRTAALGPMDVRAVLREGTVGAEIHVQGQEAHTLLAAGLPSLERALEERNLRVENIAVYQDHAGGGMSEGEKQDPHSGSSPSPQRQILPWDNAPQRSSAARGSLEDEELANPAAGLSVRA